MYQRYQRLGIREKKGITNSSFGSDSKFSFLMELEAQGEICRILEYWTEEEYLEFDEKRGEIAYLVFRYASQIQ